MPATFPYAGDFVNPETKGLLNKYIMRNSNVSAENAAQLWRYVSDLSVRLQAVSAALAVTVEAHQ